MKKFGNFNGNIIPNQQMKFINGGYRAECTTYARDSAGTLISETSMGGNCDGWSNCLPNGASTSQSTCACS